MSDRKVVRLVSAGQVDEAERVAIRGLTWISGDIDLAGGFIDRTGIRADRMREAAGSRDFLLAVLEHIMSDEEYLLLPFCGASAVLPNQVCEARDILASPHRIKHALSEGLIPKILPRRGFS
jgi:hypothetical protein